MEQVIRYSKDISFFFHKNRLSIINSGNHFGKKFFISVGIDNKYDYDDPFYKELLNFYFEKLGYRPNKINVLEIIRNRKHWIIDIIPRYVNYRPVYIEVNDVFLTGVKQPPFFILTDDYLDFTKQEKVHPEHIERKYIYTEYRKKSKPIECYQSNLSPVMKEMCRKYDEKPPTEPVIRSGKYPEEIKDYLNNKSDFEILEYSHSFFFSYNKRTLYHDLSIKYKKDNIDDWYKFNVDFDRYKNEILNFPLTKFITEFFFNNIEYKTNELSFKDLEFKFVEGKELSLTRENNCWFGQIKLDVTIPKISEKLDKKNGQYIIVLDEEKVSNLDFYFVLHDKQMQQLIDYLKKNNII